MGFVNKAVLAAGLVASAAAVNVKVRSSGGNSTKHFGIDYGYGFLHEDINNSGDGGIYAELIQNRAFQYSDAFPVNTSHYYPINGADLSIQFLGHPLSDALPASMRVSATNGSGQVGFENEGYWGMDVKAANEYTGSFWVKGAYKGCFTASFKSNLTDDVFGSVEIESKSVANDWTEHAFTLQPERDAPNSNNTFAVTFDPAGTSNGTLDFNLISVFPPTYKGRKNGLRIDIAEALEELNPTFIRFPGGNMLEGLTLGSWWDWKNTLGPLKNRPGFQGVWGYQQTNGLGIQEYLEWSEDMDLEVVVGCYAGLALDGNYTSPEELKPFVDDCLNQIEFIKGPASSEWGARRAELGHPEPYRLDYVEIGNEDWLAGYPGGWDSYKEYRFKMFFDAITKVYPDMQVIGSAASSDPAGIDPVTLELKNATDTIKYPEGVIGDYHPYREPDELVEEFDRFDNDYGHIVGEVAATHVNNGTRWEGNLYYFPWWIGSVGEAASLIGYERNSDRIPMTLYAPVLRNMNRWQWAITILQFAADPALTTRSTSWYVWSLFAHHPISETLPTTGSYGPVWWGAGKDEARDALVWKAACYNTTNGADEPVVVRFDGVKRGQKATLTVLTNNVGDPYAYNDPLAGNNIVDSTTTVLTADKKGAFHFSMPQLSVAVLDTDVEVDAPGGNPPKGGPGGYGKPPRYGGKKGGKHHGPPK